MSDSVVLRILDANLNRAREGLRVWEDYARFGLDHHQWCAEIKRMRHDLALVAREHLAEAIYFRDTPGDVGTDKKTVQEGKREGIADIVTAAGKRLQEALRSIEECFKTIDSSAASRVERIRYQSYDVEQRLARTLRPGWFDGVGLYVLITESLCVGPWLDVAKQALEGGATCIQLREKSLDSGELLSRSRALVELCRKYDALCIVNDRPDIAVLAGADGVHVGQGDLPCAEARKIVGHNRIVGVSTHHLDQARNAEREGADYIGVGPVFPSTTKPREILPGLAYARAAAAAVKIPSVAIAGITLENADEVLATGVRSLAVSSAIIATADPQAAARGFSERLKNRTASVGQAFLSASKSHLEPELQRHHRRLHHWSLDGSTYVITSRLLSGTLTPDERDRVFDHICQGNGQSYSLAAAVVMPDHFHAVLKPKKGTELCQVTKGIKGVSGQMVNQMRGTRGPVWQDESDDRIIRSQEELIETLKHIYENPVRAGLAKRPQDYPATFIDQK